MVGAANGAKRAALVSAFSILIFVETAPEANCNPSVYVTVTSLGLQLDKITYFL